MTSGEMKICRDKVIVIQDDHEVIYRVTHFVVTNALEKDSFPYGDDKFDEMMISKLDNYIYGQYRQMIQHEMYELKKLLFNNKPEDDIRYYNHPSYITFEQFKNVQQKIEKIMGIEHDAKLQL